MRDTLYGECSETSNLESLFAHPKSFTISCSARNNNLGAPQIGEEHEAPPGRGKSAHLIGDIRPQIFR